VKYKLIVNQKYLGGLQYYDFRADPEAGYEGREQAIREACALGASLAQDCSPFDDPSLEELRSLYQSQGWVIESSSAHYLSNGQYRPSGVTPMMLVSYPESEYELTLHGD
jgi:hypothetical protein